MPWLNLGTVEPPLNEWRSFPSPSINGQTFRITLLPTRPFIRYKTYALIRFSWLEGGQISYTVPRRYWPSEEPQVFDQPIPAAIGGVVWTVQIQKKVWRRFRGGQTNDGLWKVKLEDYFPE